MRKYFAVILLVGFAGWTLFGLSAMAMRHHQGSPMNGNCQLSTLPSSACPGTLAMAVYHASSYQSLLNSFVYTPVVHVLMAALLFVAVACVFRKYIASIQHLLFLFGSWRLYRNLDASLFRSQAITRWLSLLVNSPSFN